MPSKKPSRDHISKAWQVYIVRCADGTLYTGISNQLDKRVDDHNQGKGAKYTAARRPVSLVYEERADDRSGASKREYQIKSLTRRQKEMLIGNFGQTRGL